MNILLWILVLAGAAIVIFLSMVVGTLLLQKSKNWDELHPITKNLSAFIIGFAILYAVYKLFRKLPPIDSPLD